MLKILKSIISKMPQNYQQESKRYYFAYQLKKGLFKTNEIEFTMLDKWIDKGDWVLDVGANVGHYTVELSKLVGSTGRVIALEPVPETFELLASNVTRCPRKNITLMNIAASNSTKMQKMDIPTFDTGLKNYYSASLAQDKGELQVMCLPVDCLDIPNTIKLVKIDVEGHELFAIEGMSRLILRDHPVLIVEGSSDDVNKYLIEFGYSYEKIKGSPNRIFRCH